MAVLETGAARIGWAEQRHKPGQGPLYEGTRRGVGFSLHPGWHAEWQEERRGQVQAKVTLYPDGTVTLDTPTVETGTGSNTCNVLGCAEALGFLGVRPEDITWVSTVDTDSGVRDCVQTDSAVAFLQSEVLAVVAEQLKQKLLDLAAPVLGVPADQLTIENGCIVAPVRCCMQRLCKTQRRHCPPHPQRQREGVALAGRPGARFGDGEPEAHCAADRCALHR